VIGDSTRTDNGTATIHPAGPVLTGTAGTWTIQYVTGAQGIVSGGGIRVKLQRYWTKPQTEDAGAPGHITARCEKPGLKLRVGTLDKAAEGGRFEVSYRRADMPKNARLEANWGRIFVDVVEGELVEGDVVAISYCGVAPTTAGVAYPFTVATDPDGSRSALYTGYSAIERSPELLVVPETAQRIEAFIPSQFDAPAPARVHVVARDRYANPCLLPGPPDIQFQGSRAEVTSGALQTTSNYGRERASGEWNLYWGDLHVHSWRSDGVGPLETIYTYARDQMGLDFVGHGDHIQYMNDQDWYDTLALTRRMNQPGKFVSMPGFELSHNPRRWMEDGSYQNIVPWYGDKNVYYLSEDDAPIVRETDRYRSYSARFVEIAEQVRGHNGMIVPHLHAGGLMTYYDPELVRIIEAFSAHHFDLNKGGFERFESMWQEYLAAGYRVGLVGGSDNHNARAGQDTYLPWERNHRRGALMGVWAPALTREGLWRAMHDRCVYATTGARIYLDVRLNGHRMGEELTVWDALTPKALEIEVHGTAPIQSVEVLRSNSVIQTFAPDAWDFQVTFVDEAYAAGEDFYVVRVIQADMNRAWSSPIWVDLAPEGRVNFPGQEATWGR